MTRKLISIVLVVCMIMSCFAITGMSVSAATEPEATGAAQFKFTDALNWGDIRVYAWDASQNAITAAWPGDSGVQGQQNDYGQTVYTVDVPANAAGVIVNGAGGSKQTANITNFAPAGGGYYVDASRTEQNEFGMTVYTAIPWGGETPTVTPATTTAVTTTKATSGGNTSATSFLFTDAMSWGDIRVYAWDASNNAISAAWPGVSGVQGQQNDYGQMVYTINVPANAAGVIVNGANGSKQTANITNFAPAGGGYYVDASRTEQNEFGQTVYTAIPWGGTTPATTTAVTTTKATSGGSTGATSFKFSDSLHWGDIRLYAWDANNQAITAEWPGDTGVQGQANEYGEMVYTINVPANAAGVIVNGANGSKQTANITNFAPGGGGYYVLADKTEQNEFGQTVYTPLQWDPNATVEPTTKKADEPTTAPAPTSKNIYFAAPAAWDAVDFFYGQSTDFNAATKVPMTETEDTVDVTIADLNTVASGDWTVYCLEISDEMAEDVDAAKTVGFCKHGAINRTGMRSGDTVVFATETPGSYASEKAAISDFFGKVFIIDSCYDAKYENRTYTGFWQTFEQPVVATKNIYFAAPATWDAVDLFWSQTNDFNAASKTSMTKTDKTEAVEIEGLTTVTSGDWDLYKIEVSDQMATSLDEAKLPRRHP